MKKIFVVLAIVASIQVANAQQVKSVEAAQKAVEAAKAATLDAKKAAKMATWLKYGQSLLDAYNASAGNGLLNTPKEQMAFIMGADKPVSTETVTIDGETWTKDVYDTKNYYFAPNGVLSMIEITKQAVPGGLEEAVSAFRKAAELDVKGQKTKDIKTALQDIATKYVNDAYTAYSLQKFAESSVLFEQAAAAAATAPLCQTDTNSVYSAGIMASVSGDSQRCKKFMEECLRIGFDNEGEVYAKLAEVAEKDGDKEKSKEYLETGFLKNPTSQTILIGLINYYLGNSDGNNDRLFELFATAEANEPNNPSLYSSEGGAYAKLGNEEKALEAFRKAGEVDPNYIYGYTGEGQYYLDKAAKLLDEANSTEDYKKWEALVNEANDVYKKCIDPFEKAFNITKDPQVKYACAQYLKEIYYRFSSDDESYMNKYKEYNAYVKDNQN